MPVVEEKRGCARAEGEKKKQVVGKQERRRETRKSGVGLDKSSSGGEYGTEESCNGDDWREREGMSEEKTKAGLPLVVSTVVVGPCEVLDPVRWVPGSQIWTGLAMREQRLG